MPNDDADTPMPEGGILAALPRARPQRASARRAAARSATTRTNPPRNTNSKAATAQSTANQATAGDKQPAKPGKPVRARPLAGKTRATSKPLAKPTIQSSEPPAPKQGYEPEDEVELGATVSPPSGVELAESVAEIVGELATSGLTAGGRLFKDVFSLLRRP
jgi:hypothetical protein